MHKGGDWHGPFPELHVMIDTIAHYILEDALETVAEDIRWFTTDFGGGTDG